MARSWRHGSSVVLGVFVADVSEPIRGRALRKPEFLLVAGPLLGVVPEPCISCVHLPHLVLIDQPVEVGFSADTSDVLACRCHEPVPELARLDVVIRSISSPGTVHT
jgi:hypothetical protein